MPRAIVPYIDIHIGESTFILASTGKAPRCTQCAIWGKALGVSGGTLVLDAELTEEQPLHIEKREDRVYLTCLDCGGWNIHQRSQG